MEIKCNWKGMLFVVRFDNKVHMVIDLDEVSIKSHFVGETYYIDVVPHYGGIMSYTYKHREVWEYILQKMWHCMATKLWPESLTSRTESKQVVAPNEAE